MLYGVQHVSRCMLHNSYHIATMNSAHCTVVYTAPSAHPVNREHSHACREELRAADDRRERVGFRTYALHPTVQCTFQPTVQRLRDCRAAQQAEAFKQRKALLRWHGLRSRDHDTAWRALHFSAECCVLQCSTSNVAGQRMLPVYNRQHVHVHGCAPKPADAKIALE